MQEDAAFQEILIDLLVSGHVNSYSDYFSLVSSNLVPSSLTLKTLLVASEQASRLKQPKLVVKSKTDLARFFSSLNQHTLAIKYYSEALEPAKSLSSDSNVLFEFDALMNHGTALQEDGNFKDALVSFDQAKIIAKSLKNSLELLQRASKSVVIARTEISKELEKNGNYTDSIAHLETCLKIMNDPLINLEAVEKKLSHELNYLVGSAYKKINQIEPAIRYLTLYLDAQKNKNNSESDGWTRVLLASCYEAGGNFSLAIAFLEQFVASSDTQTRALSQSFFELGRLHSKLGEFVKGEEYYHRYYDCVSNDETMENRNEKVGVAKVLLGIAKGNAQMNRFFELVGNENCIKELIEWKSGNIPKVENVQLD